MIPRHFGERSIAGPKTHSEYRAPDLESESSPVGDTVRHTRREIQFPLGRVLVAIAVLGGAVTTIGVLKAKLSGIREDVAALRDSNRQALDEAARLRGNIDIHLEDKAGMRAGMIRPESVTEWPVAGGDPNPIRHFDGTPGSSDIIQRLDTAGIPNDWLIAEVPKDELQIAMCHLTKLCDGRFPPNVYEKEEQDFRTDRSVNFSYIGGGTLIIKTPDSYVIVSPPFDPSYFHPNQDYDEMRLRKTIVRRGRFERKQALIVNVYRPIEANILRPYFARAIEATHGGNPFLIDETDLDEFVKYFGDRLEKLPPLVSGGQHVYRVRIKPLEAN